MSSFRPNKKWAAANSNGLVFSVSTQSGFRRTIVDPAGCRFLFKGNEISNVILGGAVLDCLAASRILDTSELQAELFVLDRVKLNYENSVTALLEFAGVKSKRSLFREMHDCGITLEDGTITIVPMHHEKLEAWVGTVGGTNDHVKVSASSPPEIVGAGLLDAFRRCTPSYSWQKSI